MAMETGIENRGSRLRAQTIAIRYGIAEILDEKGIKANEVSFFGLKLVRFFAHRAEAINIDKPENYIEEAIVTGVGIGVSQATDAVDGPLARRQRSNIPWVAGLSKLVGGLLDAGVDRLQETDLALSRARIAYHNGDKIGELLAYAACITNFLPSIARGIAEGDGVKVEEMRLGVDIIGSRFPRAIISSVVTPLPRLGRFPLQPVADGLTVASNLVSGNNRMDQWYEKTELRWNYKKELTEEEQLEAKFRAPFMALLLLTVGAPKVISTYRDLRKN